VSGDVPARRTAPPVFLSDPALLAVLDALPAARVVGGAVRDALAGRAVADVDLATPDPPDAVIAALRRAGLRAVPTGLSHGTVTAVSDGRGFEVTTLRRDVETDGRHAVVAFTDDWRQDAARRDFTINAMSMRRDGAVSDYFGGLDDLRAGRLRFVGDPATRIAEDYLRVLRFFRFYARYATLVPDERTLAALRNAVPGLAGLSAERVWGELVRILAAPDPRDSIALMDKLGVLAAIMPEGADPEALRRLVAAGAPADPLLRVAALLAGDPGVFAERLKLSGADRDRLLALRATPLPPPDADDDDLRRLLADHARPMLIDRLWLDTGHDPGAAALRERLVSLATPVFPLEGRDVLALGVPPGPQVGALLRDVRGWWQAGGCTADAAACRAALRARVEAEAEAVRAADRRDRGDQVG
jgi:poly(A) polymerase